MNNCGVCNRFADVGNVAGVSICIDCYNNIMHTCYVCKEIIQDASARGQFEDRIMCDVCFSEECHNALASEFNETRRP